MYSINVSLFQQEKRKVWTVFSAHSPQSSYGVWGIIWKPIWMRNITRVTSALLYSSSAAQPCQHTHRYPRLENPVLHTAFKTGWAGKWLCLRAVFCDHFMLRNFWFSVAFLTEKTWSVVRNSVCVFVYFVNTILTILDFSCASFLHAE